MAILSKSVLYDMYVATELSGNESTAYKISKASADSGWSFGQCQWDLLKNTSTVSGTPRDVFRNILSNAYSDGNRIFSDAEVGTIMLEVAKSNGNISVYKGRIDLALESNYGMTAINTSYNAHLDEKLTRLNNLLGELENSGTRGAAAAADLRDNEVLQMLILDYDNKFPGKNDGGVDGIDNPGNYQTGNDGALMKLFKDGVTKVNGRTVKVEGGFDVEDFLEFLFSTKKANKISPYSGAKDLLRRVAAIIDLTETKFDLSGEERKLIDDLLGLNTLKLGARELLGKIRDLFTIAATGAGSPIVLDLDGDGVETTAVGDGTYFDQDGNGFAEQTGWAASDDGILVRDINGNGSIDNGKELFGDHTLLGDGTMANNGFQALAELDDNLDGKIDANDTAFSQLKVWKDIDGDGYSSADELESLSDAGVTLQRNLAIMTLHVVYLIQTDPQCIVL